MKNKFEINATIVSNEFIDQYMASANGEYVKVYLYLLRYQEHEVTVTEMADALNHTESDIKRALTYWQRQGVLVPGETKGQPVAEARRTTDSQKRAETLKEAEALANTEAQERVKVSEQKKLEAPEQAKAQKRAEVQGRATVQGGASSGESGQTQEQAGGQNWTAVQKEAKETAAIAESQSSKQRQLYTPEQVSRLAEEEDFTQLLYISQKYMNKVFTPRECEVFAYLYDALRMPVELLEYLVEYCVQGGHYSIRYLETIALDWHERKICTVAMAKQYTASFSNEAFAVMKAFGLNERRPGDAEMAMIRRWFREWGFTKELVLEACGRTLKATHNPSFSYADKILSEWKKAGVKVMADIKKMDEKRENRKAPKPETAAAPAKLAKNQFHNFEQRDTDYDGMVLERLKQRLETQ